MDETETYQCSAKTCLGETCERLPAAGKVSPVSVVVPLAAGLPRRITRSIELASHTLSNPVSGKHNQTRSAYK
jgi:hypothetical protein